MAVLLAAALMLRRCEDPEPVPIEEGFLREPVQQIQRTKDFEQQHLDQVRERQREMDRRLEEDGG